MMPWGAPLSRKLPGGLQVPDLPHLPLSAPAEWVSHALPCDTKMPSLPTQRYKSQMPSSLSLLTERAEGHPPALSPRPRKLQMPYLVQVHRRLSLHHSWKGRRDLSFVDSQSLEYTKDRERSSPKWDPPTIYSRISWWIGENADSLSPCQLSEVKAQESASQGHLHGQKWLLHLAMYSSKCSSSPTYRRWDQFSGLQLVLLKQEREHNKREDNWMYHFVVKIKYCFIELFVLVTYVQIWADQEVRPIF